MACHEIMKASILAFDGVLRAYGFNGDPFPQNVPMNAGSVNRWISKRANHELHLVRDDMHVTPETVGRLVSQLIAILEAPAWPV